LTPQEIEKRLAQLKVLTEETDEGGIAAPCDGCDLCPGALPMSTRDYTDAQLLIYLEMADYDVRDAAYNVLLRKAQNSGITLASGITLPDNSAYWLRLAAIQRRSRTGVMLRADEPRRGEE
jgi:hypothetical protein